MSDLLTRQEALAVLRSAARAVPLIKRAKDVMIRAQDFESALTLREAEFLFRSLLGLYKIALREGNPAVARKTRKGAKR